MAYWRKFRTGMLCAALFCAGSMARAQVTETNGMVRIEAESFVTSRTNSIGGTDYAWLRDEATPGFSGTGYIEASPADGASTTTVESNWPTTSPQINYSVTFSNPGTYYIWVRGFAGDASSAGVYLGLNGASLANPRIDMQQFNGWSWANTSATNNTPVALTIPSAGTYTLNLWMRDAWLDVDRIVLTRNPNFSPAPDPNFWRNQNIYQIITDRFFDGDPSNNNVYGGAESATGNKTHGGDWAGVERKLDYIKALGATAIWISPVLKNGNGDFDYHGYAATDFYNVDPRFGSLQDLQRLIREAQKRGILVINDVVVNHGSTWVDSGDAGWPNFSLSGYDLRYNSGGRQYAAPFDPSSVNDFFRNSNLANIFHNNGTTQNWSDSTQVELGELLSLDDFKTETPYIRQKMKEIWTHWIETVGFDAYRLDTVKHVEMGFWDDWSPAIRAAAQAADKPNFFQFGEIFDGSDAKVGSYTGTKTSGVYKMESALDYPLYYQVGSVFATASGGTGAIETRYNNLTTAHYDSSALDSLILNLDNHDNPRFLAATGSTTARLEMALVFMYTTRGIPSLYYGTEQDFNGGADPANREDMFDGLYEQGPSLGDNFNMTHPRFQLVAKLNNLRRLYPALRTGTHHILWVNWSAPGLLAYARRLGNEEVYVVMNTATSAQTIGSRPTIHAAGTVLVNLFNPAETVTTVAGTDGIPSMTIPASSFKAFVSQAQFRALQPVISTVSPNHDSTGVSVASSVRLDFSQAMNTNSVAFSTAPPTTGSTVWSPDKKSMTYTPSSTMAGNTLYTVRVESSATDTNNLAMQSAFESRFTTGAGASLAPPSINSASSSDIADSTAALNTTVTPNGVTTSVRFEYGTTPDLGSPTSTSAENIGSGDSPVSVSISLSALQAGTTYYFRAVATNSQGTTTGNTLTFTTSTPLPVVTTMPATFVEPYGANLNGDVTPNGLSTSVYFEWGDRSDVLANSNAPTPIGSGTSIVGSFARVDLLSPDSTYFYRVVALSSNNGVTKKTYGATLNFKTPPVKPTVTTLATTNVSVTNALLPGTVNPNASPTVYFFEYGTNSSYGTTTTSASAGNGTNAIPVSATISNLAAGQTYFYRAAASNSFGVTYGAEQKFSAGLPPPSATTLTPASLTTSSAQLRGSINPNNSFASAWFEWGTTTNYGSTSRIVASDDGESLSSFNIGGGGTVSSGTGFGTYSRYATGTGAGTFLAINSSNQTIDGSKTFGAYGGSGTGISFRRSISTTRQYGRATVSARFNVDNTKGFAGFNLKSSDSGRTGFGSGELVSFGIAPAGGNNGILVTDSSGQRVLNLGADVRNTIIDFKVDFDAQSRRYVVGAKFRTNSSFTTMSGTMSGTGTTVSHIGFANWNSTGALQDLMFDSLQVLGSMPLGGGTNQITVSNNATGLTANRLYHYRIASMNLDGGITYGANASFYTGIDLAISATNTNSSLVQGGTGQFTVTISNVGALTSTTNTVTVSNQIPAGMTITSMNGTGWTNINLSNGTATRSGSLNVGASYPPLTVGFSVASNASSQLTNQVTVSGGGDGNALNNTGNLTWSVLTGPDLVVTKSTNSIFTQGTIGSFVVSVANVGGAPTTGAVTVTEQPPVGMEIVSITGTGWNSGSSNAVTRSDSLVANSNYPPITVSVAVASNAASVLTNVVAVTGGGDTKSNNNTAQSIANVVLSLAPLDAWKTLHFGTTTNSGAAADTYVATEDGMPNLLKYALGLDPTNAAALADRPSMHTFPPLAIKFRRTTNATDVTIHVEATDSVMNSWSNIWTSATNNYDGTLPFQEIRVEDPVPAADSVQRYLRLKVTRP